MIDLDSLDWDKGDGLLPAIVQDAGNGRVLIRKSGTEPLIRVMVEADDEALVTETVESLATFIRACSIPAEAGSAVVSRVVPAAVPAAAERETAQDAEAA